MVLVVVIVVSSVAAMGTVIRDIFVILTFVVALVVILFGCLYLQVRVLVVFGVLDVLSSGASVFQVFRALIQATRPIARTVVFGLAFSLAASALIGGTVSLATSVLIGGTASLVTSAVASFSVLPLGVFVTVLATSVLIRTIGLTTSTIGIVQPVLVFTSLALTLAVVGTGTFMVPWALSTVATVATVVTLVLSGSGHNQRNSYRGGDI